MRLGAPTKPDRSLGCYHRKFEIGLGNGKNANAIEYDMREFVRGCVEHNLE